VKKFRKYQYRFQKNDIGGLYFEHINNFRFRSERTLNFEQCITSQSILRIGGGDLPGLPQNGLVQILG